MRTDQLRTQSLHGQVFVITWFRGQARHVKEPRSQTARVAPVDVVE
jgi:hypothetical protein